MNRNDAEVYLKEIAKSDSFGTKIVGLSVHCVGLDFAYRITRNFIPNIDFRFVPHINEIQSLLNQQINKDEFIFEDSQQKKLKVEFDEFYNMAIGEGKDKVNFKYQD